MSDADQIEYLTRLAEHLGERLDLGRPLRPSEMGHILGVNYRQYRRWIKGETTMQRPTRRACYLLEHAPKNVLLTIFRECQK